MLLFFFALIECIYRTSIEMNAELRRIHHLNKNESDLLLAFRLLPPEIKTAILGLASVHAQGVRPDHENVITLSRRMAD